MAIVRKKKLDIDGAEFIIGSLTMDQVEEVIKFNPKDKGIEVLRERAEKLVIQSFNNAGFKTPSDTEWDSAAVNREIDLESFNRLQTEILDWSKLKAIPSVVSDSEATSGEAPAVP